MQAYDIIGDIHGYADELNTVLEKLGYQEGAHAEGRKVVFLGDFIDRGPKIREVLETVRSMVDQGTALVILGNHEVNAMRFHTRGRDGKFLRPHSPKNIKQHEATLEQFPDPAGWGSWIDWFAGLPLSLDLGAIRVVHACWDQQAVDEIERIGRLESRLLEEYSVPGSAGHETISRLINGPEALLPDGFEHRTADGNMRAEFRVKWWMNLEGLTCREAIFPDDDSIPDLPPGNLPRTGYPEDAPPTFFGHYASKEKVPGPVRPNLACLDYGVGKGGFLCAYRWEGETELDPRKFVTA